MAGHDAVLERLLDRHGRTYADELGLDLHKGTPSALFGLLLFAVLSSARIRSVNAAEATKALLDAGWSSVAKLAGTSSEQRVRVLNRNGYARYDERTASMLGDLVEQVQERYRGDLRRVRKEADGDVKAMRDALTDLRASAPSGQTSSCARRSRPGPRSGRTSTSAPRTRRGRSGCRRSRSSCEAGPRGPARHPRRRAGAQLAGQGRRRPQGLKTGTSATA